MTETHGLCKKRPRTCPCGVVFVAKTPQARYCSKACADRYIRFGRSYNKIPPEQQRVYPA